MTEYRLAIATPVRASTLENADVKYGYHRFTRQLEKKFDPVCFVDAEIAFSTESVRARNRIAAAILREPAFASITHVLWLDDDQWADDPAIVGEMMQLGVGLVGAPYTNKKVPMCWIHQQLSPCPPPEGRLQEVRLLGFGFTMTSRECLMKMSANARRYRDAPHNHKVPDIFAHRYAKLNDSVDPEDETKLSEDYSFCETWRDLGEKVYLYARSGLIRHSGGKAYSAQDMPGGVIG